MYQNPYQNFLNQTSPQYNNYPQYQPPISKPTSSDIIQVNGLEGAKAYQIPPNSRLLALDMNLPIVYIKVSDSAGFCTVKEYDLIPREEKPIEPTVIETPQNTELETRLKTLEIKMEELINEQSVIKKSVTTTSTTTEPTKSTESQSRKHNGRT